jgi:tetratricopeptide (TPR) repeat protein
MSRPLKIAIYAVLAACLIIFGLLAARTYNRDRERFRERRSQAAETNLVDELPAGTPQVGANGGGGSWALYGALALGSLVVLALMFARDVSHTVANRVEEFIFNDDLKGVRDPEYEEAEKIWANGRHLEAIQLMRDYLKKHPSEQYVAIRIAEIYEKDLANYLAAALEYQEILKKKLPPDRWGWAAIHLANLYSGKLEKPDEAEALLRRIINEHPQTPAAKKARERLGEPEQLIVTAQPVEVKHEKEEPKSNLPPGFRPK